MTEDRRYEDQIAGHPEILSIRERLHEVSNQLHAATVRVEVTAVRLDGEVTKLDKLLRQLDRIEASVRVLEQAKANMDGRMVILSGGAGIVGAVIAWMLTRWFPQ